MTRLTKSLIYNLLLLSICFLFSTGCSKENDDSNADDEEGTPVMVSGTLDATAAQATEILAISSDYHYKRANISNNQFSIQLDNSKPWGLVFLNEADQPLGLLSLGNGLESLPLHCINPSINKIDLGTIVMNTKIFTPSNNPIGNAIVLSAEQLPIVAAMDDYLAAILKNPDVNGNGKIDLLEGKSYTLSVLYFIKPGKFKAPGLTPTLDPTTLIEGYRLSLTVEDANYPETVYYTGPAGSSLSNSPSQNYLAYDDARIYYTTYLFDPMGYNKESYIPPGGTYTINYGNSTLTFNLPDQSYVNTNIVYPWPTITLNENGTLKQVDWVYKQHAGTVNFSLSALIHDIMVQLGGNGPACTAIPNQNGLYGSGRLPYNTTSHIFACQNINWGNAQVQPESQYVDLFMMTYADHFGATYVVMYDRSY